MDLIDAKVRAQFLKTAIKYPPVAEGEALPAIEADTFELAYSLCPEDDGWAYVYYDNKWHEDPSLLFPRDTKKVDLPEVGTVAKYIKNIIKENKMLMKFDPATGAEKPYPSEAGQYRAYHGKVAWLFNPYSGDRRAAGDVGSDTFGHAIVDLAEVRQFTERDKDAR